MQDVWKGFSVLLLYFWSLSCVKEFSNVYTAHISSSVSVTFFTFQHQGVPVTPTNGTRSDHVLVTSLVTPTHWSGTCAHTLCPPWCSSPVGEMKQMVTHYVLEEAHACLRSLKVESTAVQGKWLFQNGRKRGIRNNVFVLDLLDIGLVCLTIFFQNNTPTSTPTLSDWTGVARWECMQGLNSFFLSILCTTTWTVSCVQRSATQWMKVCACILIEWFIASRHKKTKEFREAV